MRPLPLVVATLEWSAGALTFQGREYVRLDLGVDAAQTQDLTSAAQER